MALTDRKDELESCAEDCTAQKTAPRSVLRLHAPDAKHGETWPGWLLSRLRQMVIVMVLPTAAMNKWVEEWPEVFFEA